MFFQLPHAVLAIDWLRRHEAMNEAEYRWLRRQLRPSRRKLWDHILTTIGEYLITIGTKLQEQRSAPLPKSL
jgi:hypothetical protein